MSPTSPDKSTVADATHDEQGRSAVQPIDAASRQVAHDAQSAGRRRAVTGRRPLGWLDMTARRFSGPGHERAPERRSGRPSGQGKYPEHALSELT